MVLKATVFPEWNTNWLVPFYHYVVRHRHSPRVYTLIAVSIQPIQHDYSDLYNTVAFFAGSPDGTGGHDDLAEKIANRGVEFAAKHWRWEDMQAYVGLRFLPVSNVLHTKNGCRQMFRLLLEYARASSFDREKMTYKM